MELKIYNPQDDGFIQKIEWNFEELKKEISVASEEYAVSVYTDDAIKLPRPIAHDLTSLSKRWRERGKSLRRK